MEGPANGSFNRARYDLGAPCFCAAAVNGHRAEKEKERDVPLSQHFELTLKAVQLTCSNV